MTVALYVGNLPWTTREEDLIAWVSTVAPVKAARIILDRETGRSRGYGFVEVADVDAEKVIAALNGTVFGGRTITISQARARQR
jgi:RNA recognition motif-containing protein